MNLYIIFSAIFATIFLFNFGGADKCTWQNCPKWSTAPDAINVHMIAHTHDDMGWIKTADDYYTGARPKLVDVGIQYILNTVIDELAKDPARRFSYAEAGFLHRWLIDHGPEQRERLRKLVTESGQLELIGGGWTQPDEAATHYVNLVDEYSLGLGLFNATFGPVCGHPKVAWQIDPFGHSREHANLVALMGHESLFFARQHYLELAERAKQRELELVWTVSDELKTKILTGGFLRGTYAPPDGFCFDQLCQDEPIQDNPAFEGYNVEPVVERFLNIVKTEAESQRHGHVMMTMGGDFQYSNANKWFTQLDKLIHALNARSNGTKVHAFYSTPSCYVSAATSTPGLHLPVKEEGDFFPYATGNHSYWAGYFTSKPALKGLIRQSSALLQLARAFGAASPNGSANGDGLLVPLEQATALCTHHDAVTGTSKENVTRDYTRRLLSGWTSAEASLNASFWRIAGQKSSASLATPIGHPPLHFCPLSNQTICPFTRVAANFSLTLFNGQSQQQMGPAYGNAEEWTTVRIPFYRKTVPKVMDAEGKEMPAELVPTFYGGLQQQIVGEEPPAPFQLCFRVPTLPPLGFRTYFVISTVPDKRKRLAQLMNGQSEFWRENLPKFFQLLDQTNRDRWERRAGRIGTGGMASADAMDGTGNGTNTTATISNNFFRLTFGTDGLLSNVYDVRLNRTFRLRQQFHFYRGMSNGTSGKREAASGAYIFRPNGTSAEDFPGSVKLQIVNGTIVQEARQVVNGWISQTIRLVADRPYIEFQWMVGPLPKNKSALESTEVVTRYTLEGLQSGSLFSTDANGRQMVQRRRNDPAKFYEGTEPVAANYYPVNSRIWVKDGQQTQMTVLTDRSQGGTSLADGQIKLMLHRRCFWDDGWGVEEALDEPGEDGRGLIVSGRHWLLIGLAGDSAHRPLALEMFHSSPAQTIGFAPLDFVQNNVTKYTALFHTEFSALAPDVLPPNVHLLTLRPLDREHILLRLEHFYQQNENIPRPENALPVHVDIQKMFKSFTPVSAEELGLAADRAVQTMGKRSGFAGMVIELRPMEIRTFRVQITY